MIDRDFQAFKFQLFPASGPGWAWAPGGRAAVGPGHHSAPGRHCLAGGRAGPRYSAGCSVTILIPARAGNQAPPGWHIAGSLALLLLLGYFLLIGRGRAAAGLGAANYSGNNQATPVYWAIIAFQAIFRFQAIHCQASHYSAGLFQIRFIGHSSRPGNAGRRSQALYLFRQLFAWQLIRAVCSILFRAIFNSGFYCCANIAGFAASCRANLIRFAGRQFADLFRLYSIFFQYFAFQVLLLFPAAAGPLIRLCAFAPHFQIYVYAAHLPFITPPSAPHNLLLPAPFSFQAIYRHAASSNSGIFHSLFPFILFRSRSPLPAFPPAPGLASAATGLPAPGTGLCRPPAFRALATACLVGRRAQQAQFNIIIII